MPGWIRVDLEVVCGGRLLGSLQHLCTQRHDAVVGRREVLDPQVEWICWGGAPSGQSGGM